jgi:hypothetical protein
MEKFQNISCFPENTITENGTKKNQNFENNTFFHFNLKLIEISQKMQIYFFLLSKNCYLLIFALRK